MNQPDRQAQTTPGAREPLTYNQASSSIRKHRRHAQRANNYSICAPPADEPSRSSTPANGEAHDKRALLQIAHHYGKLDRGRQRGGLLPVQQLEGFARCCSICLFNAYLPRTPLREPPLSVSPVALLGPLRREALLLDTAPFRLNELCSMLSRASAARSAARSMLRPYNPAASRCAASSRPLSSPIPNDCAVLFQSLHLPSHPGEAFPFSPFACL